MPNTYYVDDKIPVHEVANEAIVADSVSPGTGVTAHGLTFCARIAHCKFFKEGENPALD